MPSPSPHPFSPSPSPLSPPPLLVSCSCPTTPGYCRPYLHHVSPTVKKLQSGFSRVNTTGSQNWKTRQFFGYGRHISESNWSNGIPGQSAICGLLLFADCRPSTGVAFQSHETRDGINGCDTISSPFLGGSSYFHNLSDVGGHFGKEWDFDGCSHPTTNVPNQIWVLGQIGD